MDWLYSVYEVVSVVGILAFGGASLVVTGYWSWVVWAPRSSRILAAFDIKEERKVDDRTASSPSLRNLLRRSDRHPAGSGDASMGR